MLSDAEKEAINRTLGYEASVLLMRKPEEPADLVRLIPYEIERKQVDRILHGLGDVGLVQMTKHPRNNLVEFNGDEITLEEQTFINQRAIERMRDPAPTLGDGLDVSEIPDRFFLHLNREDFRDDQADDEEEQQYTSSTFADQVRGSSHWTDDGWPDEK